MTRRRMALLPSLLLPFLTFVHAGDDCASYSREVPLRSAVSSAAVWANVLRLPSSLISESGKMLTEAEREATRADRPADLCPTHCSLPETPQIVFHSSPRKTAIECVSPPDRVTRLQTERAIEAGALPPHGHEDSVAGTPFIRRSTRARS